MSKNSNTMTTDATIELVTRYVRSQRTQEPPKPTYWTLYATNNRVLSKADRPVWKNTEIGDLEDSLLELENAMGILFETSPNRSFVLLLKTDPKDGGVSLMFDNPNYQSRSSNSNQVSGTNTYIDTIIMLNKEISNIRIENMQKEHEREMNELYDAIEGIKNEKQSFWGKIGKVLETNTALQNVGIAAIAKIFGFQIPASAIAGNHEPDAGEEEEEEEENDDYTPEQKEYARKVNLSIKKLRTVFPDVTDMLLELADYAEKNPAQAVYLRQSIKPKKNNEKGT